MTAAPRIGAVLSTIGVDAASWLERARRLEAAGYGVTRFTADQVLHDPDDTLARATRAVLGPQ